MEFENVPYAAATVKRLLIIAPNWLGDAVMALPAIADVRRGASGVTIDVAARPSVAPLFTLVERIGEIVVLRHRGTLTRDFAIDLRDRSYDAALLLPNSFPTALTAWRAGIRERWGYRTAWRGPLLTRAIPTPRGVHQAAYYQHLTQTLGFARGPLEPCLEVPESHRRSGAEILVAAGWDRRTPLVALAPGAAYGGAKRWPAGSFRALAEALAREGIASVLVGGAGDQMVGDEVNSPVSINLIGRSDLPTLAGVLANCRGLVSNDSGAAHYGAALGLRVTAMFGPTDERATRPLGKVEPAVLIHDVWCRPCMQRECLLDHRCMRRITVEAVLAAARPSR